jgi:hypothetical protein
MTNLEKGILFSCWFVLFLFSMFSFAELSNGIVPALINTILALGIFTAGWFIFKRFKLIGATLIAIAASPTLFIKVAIIAGLFFSHDGDLFSRQCIEISPIIFKSFISGPMLVVIIVLAIFLFFADSTYGDKSNNWRSYP